MAWPLAGHTGLLVCVLPEINSTSARVLLLLVVPSHLLFLYVICAVEGLAVANRTFVVLYLLAGLVQVRPRHARAGPLACPTSRESGQA